MLKAAQTPTTSTPIARRRGSPAAGGVTDRRDSSVVTLPAEIDGPCAGLPFVYTPIEGRRDFWRVASSGNFIQDCTIGKVFGQAMLAYMRQDAQGLGPVVLAWVVTEMIKKGPNPAGRDGLVVGFISAIGDAAMGRVRVASVNVVEIGV